MSDAIRANESGQDGRAPTNESLQGGARGWHARGYLAHFDAGEAPQSITFRLAGSLPTHLLQRWREEVRPIAKREAAPGAGEGQSAVQQRAMAAEERRRIEEYLNQGIGPTWLA